MAYSKDFKQLVLSKLAQGMTTREVAQEFGIALSTVVYWKRPQTEKKPQQRTARKISQTALLADVARYPDAYGYERAKRFNCSASGIYKALKRCNITYKKRPTATLKHATDSEENS